MGRYIGVDEAGRGPVIGSLFIGAVAATDRSLLPDAVDDSKRLAGATRHRLSGELTALDTVDTTVVELDVETIDTATDSLTQQVAAGFARAIDRLAGAGDEVVVDAGEADERRFQTRVTDLTSTAVSVDARIKADATDPLVGAASIVAKEAREAHVRDLATEYGDIGSGYPSDLTTRSFLLEYVEDHGELPACARRSWSTCDDILATAEQADLGSFDGID